MKQIKKKEKKRKPKPEDMMKQIQRIFQKRGSKALEIAKKEILNEKVTCKEAREALSYFMTEYWHDVARPSLLSLSCEAVGGNSGITTPIAVPMILISGALDIHDDIVDQSKTKDGRMTVFGKFGKDIALLVGDALLFEGFVLLSEALKKGFPSEKANQTLHIVKNMFFELGDAEALELPLRGRIDIAPEEYLRIVQKKAADVEAHTKISAIIGNGSEKEIKALSEYGRILGMLIVLRDDWLDMMDPDEIRQRLKKECLPLPLLYALRHRRKHELHVILKKERLTRRDATTIRELTYELGGVQHQKKFMQTLVDTAGRLLSDVKYKKSELTLLLHAMLPYEEKNISPTTTKGVRT